MTDTHYLVIHVTPDHHETTIGEVAVDAAGMLALTSASQEQSEYLRDWVKKLNERAEFTLKVPPPKSADGPILSLYGQVFTRGQADFLQNLKLYVRQLYGIKLMTQDELSQELEDMGKQGL